MPARVTLLIREFGRRGSRTSDLTIDMLPMINARQQARTIKWDLVSVWGEYPDLTAASELSIQAVELQCVLDNVCTVDFDAALAGLNMTLEAAKFHHSLVKKRRVWRFKFRTQEQSVSAQQMDVLAKFVHDVLKKTIDTDSRHHPESQEWGFKLVVLGVDKVLLRIL